MTRAQIIYWRDIPVQVKVRGEQRISRQLSPRFQQAVHRAAYRARAITGFDYMQEWHPSAWQEFDEPPAEVLAALTAGLEAAYDDERLERLARNKGFEPDDD